MLAPGREVDEDDEWRVVTATGTYLPDETVIVRYRTREGSAGVDVVVPLQTTDGPAVLVDRGWLATDNTGGDVRRRTGSARRPGDRHRLGARRRDRRLHRRDRPVHPRHLEPTDRRSTRSRGLRRLPRPEERGPSPGTELAKAELPDLGNGPHFFYGLQWWFFGLLALFGFCYLVYDEWRGGPGGARLRRRPAPEDDDDQPAQKVRSIPPSTGTMAPVTNDAAGDMRNAATRPNSSGSP